MLLSGRQLQGETASILLHEAIAGLRRTFSAQNHSDLVYKVLDDRCSLFNMWKPSVFFRISDHALLQTNRCLCCQLRSARIQIQSRSSVRYFALKSGKKPSESVATTAPSQQPSTKFQFKQNVSPSQPGSNPGDEDFIPPALDRPIGLAFPPQEGQNTGIDARTIRERRDDFVNYDKHLERRKEL